MKRTTRNPVRTGLFQTYIVLHNADDVGLPFEIVDEGLRETHELFYEPASWEDQIMSV